LELARKSRKDFDASMFETELKNSSPKQVFAIGEVIPPHYLGI